MNSKRIVKWGKSLHLQRFLIGSLIRLLLNGLNQKKKENLFFREINKYKKKRNENNDFFFWYVAKKRWNQLFLSHTVVLTSSKLQSCMLKWNFNLNWRGNMYQYTPKNIPHQRRQKQILYFKRNSPIILNMKNNHAWCSYQIYLPRLNKTYVALISSC